MKRCAITEASRVTGGFVVAALVSFAMASGCKMASQPGDEAGRDLDGAHQSAKIRRHPPSLSIVDALLQELEWGQIAFNVPSTMGYKERYVVELLLSTTASAPDLQAQLEKHTDLQAAEIRISNRMEAQLTGTGFSIQRIEPELQAISRQTPTRWRWEITPTGHGTSTLHLALYAHLDIAGADTPYVLRTFDRTIQVNITLPQRLSGFFLKNWQWLWAALLVPIAGYFWKRRKTRNRPASTRSRNHPHPTGASL